MINILKDEVFKYEWNNILHFAAKNIFSNILFISNPKVMAEVNNLHYIHI